MRIFVVLALLGLAAALLYGLLVLALAAFSDKFVFIPTRSVHATPNAVGLEYEEVFLRTEDGIDIWGWYVPASGRESVVLFCHGNAGNLSHRLESLRVFSELGFSCLIFDYRGFGKSTGRPTEEGTHLDAEAAWRYLVEQKEVQPGRIVVFGRSLGGAVAARLALRHRPGALVVESSFTTMPDLAATLAPFLPVRRLLPFEYATVRIIGNIQCPVLIIHSRDDELIPFRFGQALFAAAAEPKELLPIKGSHNNGFRVSIHEYKAGWGAFIAKYGIR